jgi:chromate reductase
MKTPINVLGFAGSLRKGSYNRGLLRAAQEVVPENMRLEIFDLALIPLYNNDIEANPPQAVLDFKARLAAADALLIACPEYNYSISGVLKNAIDWASRPPKESPLNGKPVAIIGAGGGLGTARAQYHLRQVAVFTNMFPLNKPEFMVPRAWEKFDASGNLSDEGLKERLAKVLVALVEWTWKIQG